MPYRCRRRWTSRKYCGSRRVINTANIRQIRRQRLHANTRASDWQSAHGAQTRITLTLSRSLCQRPSSKDRSENAYPEGPGVCFLSLRERHVSSQFDDFSQLIHPFFTNVHRLIASRSLCSLCALILPRQTPFHFHWLCVPLRFLTILASSHSALIALYTWLRSSLRSAPAFAVSPLPRDPRFPTTIQAAKAIARRSSLYSWS